MAREYSIKDIQSHLQAGPASVNDIIKTYCDRVVGLRKDKSLPDRIETLIRAIVLAEKKAIDAALVEMEGGKRAEKKFQSIPDDQLHEALMIEDEYNETIARSVRRAVLSFAAVGCPAEINRTDAELEYLEPLYEQARARGKRLALQLTYYKNSGKELEAELTRDAIEENRAYTKKLFGKVYQLRRNKKSEDDITEEMIATAKGYPYEQLIDINRRHMAVCPFHADKDPSFHVKNNYGHCYGCHWHGDTIDFLMRSENVTFVEAVKKLAA